MEYYLEIILLIIALVSVLIYLTSKTSRKPSRFPPGPTRLPILGSMPFMTDEVKQGKKRLADFLAEKWGEVAGFYMGNQPAVFISDLEKLRRIFKTDEASGRPINEPYNSQRYGYENKGGHPRGLLFSSGEEWKDQRRFALRSLRDLGFGKLTMEDAINEEVEKLVEVLKKKEGQAVGLNLQMNISIVNALWVVLVGEKLELDDPKLLNIVKTLDDFIRQDASPNFVLAQIGPWAVKWFSSHYRMAKSWFSQVKALILPYIEDHQKNTSDDSKDFIDVYLKEIEKTIDKESSFYGRHGTHSLISSLLDLFVAGTETTSSTLLWGILFLLHHPEVQVKIHKEIDNVMGERKDVSWADRESLPYTCAAINEILRMSSIVQTGLPHQTTADIELDEYVIPKGSFVFGNLKRIHYDERYWKNPNTFDPERFFDKENNKCLSSNNLIPFMVGKRFCLGQTLAEKELFIFFVGLMKAFKFYPSPNHPLPNCGYDSGTKRSVIRSSPLYNVILKSKN